MMVKKKHTPPDLLSVQSLFSQKINSARVGLPVVPAVHDLREKGTPAVSIDRGVLLLQH